MIRYHFYICALQLRTVHTTKRNRSRCWTHQERRILESKDTPGQPFAPERLRAFQSIPASVSVPKAGRATFLHEPDSEFHASPRSAIAYTLMQHVHDSARARTSIPRSLEWPLPPKELCTHSPLIGALASEPGPSVSKPQLGLSQSHYPVAGGGFRSEHAMITSLQRNRRPRNWEIVLRCRASTSSLCS
jgi:hypothetical protein